MRIVKEWATISNAELANNYWKKVVRIDDTIEITDVELCEIGYQWAVEHYQSWLHSMNNITKPGKSFAQYLRELISLAGKGE